MLASTSSYCCNNYIIQ